MELRKIISVDPNLILLGMAFTQKFSVSQESYESLAEDIRNKFGLNLEGNSGQIERNGFQGGYSYDPESQELEIRLDKTPWMIADSMIKSTISSTVEKFGGKPL